jgi:predicted ATP-grasp superfamily ATP-dependent carboligase
MVGNATHRATRPPYSDIVLTVERRPELRDPVLVVALSGWVDAGLAGAGAIAYLVQQLQTVRRFGRIDLSDVMDLQQVRPTVKLDDGLTRTIEWPSIELVAGSAGRDLVVVYGPEPSTRWRAVTDELVGLARELRVGTAVMLGGIPTPMSHRRPTHVLATATRHSLLQEIGGTRPDYNGPTGLQTVLQVALGDADIPAVGLWAQVPHYVSTTPSPVAVRALLERLRDIAGVTVDLGALDGEVDAYRERLEESISERPDVAEIVRQLEANEDDVPSGDDLVSEIERFLRQGPDQDS